MSNIYSNNEFKLYNLVNTYFKYDEELDSLLNNWMYNKKRNSHDIMEKIICLTEPYHFDINYLEFDKENNTFYLKENDNIISFKLIYGDLDEFPKLVITNSGIESIYELEYNDKNDSILINTYRTKDNNLNYTQYYFCSADIFSIEKGNYTYHIHIDNPDESNYSFLISNKLKKQLIESDLDTFEIFEFLHSHLGKEIKSYSITKYDQYNNELDNINIQDNMIYKLKITKVNNNGEYVEIQKSKYEGFSITMSSNDFNLLDENIYFENLSNDIELKLKNR